MQLVFETIVELGSGGFPNVIQYPDTSAQIFAITGGVMYGRVIDKLNGDFATPILDIPIDVSPGDNITNLSIQALPGFGAVGSYVTGNIHKLIIYEFQHDISEYLNSATIKHTVDDQISSFTLSLENPNIQDPEHPGNIAINEDKGLLNPGAKIQFFFGAGNKEPEFEMGTLYIDRSDFTLASETASVDGRNTIGKVLGLS